MTEEDTLNHVFFFFFFFKPCSVSDVLNERFFAFTYSRFLGVPERTVLSRVRFPEECWSLSVRTACKDVRVLLKVSCQCPFGAVSVTRVINE